MTIDIAVVGGGVSGLGTAYELTRQGHRVVVLERQARAGGNAISERIDGFLMEHGPSSLNAVSPTATDYSHALELEGQRCELGPDVRHRYLVRHGRLAGIATHPLGFLTSSYLSPSARLRVLGEPFVTRRRGTGDESVGDFFRRRFGREFADGIIDPLVAGLFAGTADELSIAALFPRLIELEARYGSLTYAVIRKLLAGKRAPTRRLFSWRDGVAALPRALSRALGDRVHTGIPVRGIAPAPGGFRIDAGTAGAFVARAVVLATQPHVAAQLLDSIDAEAASAAGSIQAPPLAVVFFGYRREQVEHPLDGLGYLTPTGERRAVSGALFCSTMFADRAPSGHVALAGYIGGRRSPEAALRTAAELEQMVAADFRDLLGARGRPVVSRVRQWPRGLPLSMLGHGTVVDALAGASERMPGMFVTGNYFSGVSVAACLERAQETAAAAHQYVRRTATKVAWSHGG